MTQHDPNAIELAGPAVGDRGAWRQLPGESDALYRRFCVWLHGNREFPATDLADAMRWRWTERALAYEAYITMRGMPPRERLKEAATSLLDVFLLEARKLLDYSRESPRPILKTSDLLVLAKWFSDGLGQARSDEATDRELSDAELDQLSDAELRAIVDGRKALQRLRGGQGGGGQGT